MPNIPSCVSSVYTAGSIPSSIGSDRETPVLSSTVDPDDYDPSSLTYSLDFSKFYNSFYAGAI